MASLNDLKHLALDLAEEGIALLDSQGAYTYLNRAHVELFGYTSELELLGRKWHMFYGEDEIARLEQEAFPVIASQGSWRGETLGRKIDGSVIHQLVSLTSLPEGGLMCITHSTDWEKEMLMQLRQRTNSMDSLVHHISDGILMETVDRVIVSVNATLGEMAGLPLPVAEVVGTISLEALQLVKEQALDPDAFITAIEKRVGDGVAVFDELVELKNGKVLSRDFIPVKNGEELEGYLWVYHDVTEQERVKQELEAVVKRERELNKLQGQFLHMISHEFKKPILNTLRGTSILKSTLAGDVQNVSLAQSLDYIIQEMERLNSNVNRMVSFQSILTSSNIVLRPVRVAHLITNYLNYNYGMFTDSLKFEVKDDVPPKTEVLADMEMLNLVLANLIDNALKYSEFHQRVVVSSRLTECGKVQWEFVNPIKAGQSPQQSLLGRALYRANSADDNGLGLGLSIVHHIVELHCGQLTFETQNNEFCVRLSLRENR
jgi:PAS domain S-box-containing protein